MTDSTDNSTDDAEKMRLAFEQFMLTGGKNKNNNNNNKNSHANKSNDGATTPQSTSNKSKKKKKKKRQSTGGATPTKAVATPPVSATKQQQPSPQSRQSATPNPKVKKRYYQLLRSFSDKVKHTWIDIDEQLLSVLQNIVSIRGRLPHEWTVLSQVTRYHHNVDEEEVDESRPEQEEKVFDHDDGDDWKSHGHQEASTKGSSQYYTHHLHLIDVQLALSHDLEQHEKMLIGLRSLMSNLAECHDALGRIVDSLWQFHFEVGDEGEGEEMMKDDSLEYIVTCVTESYQMLSMELYRKQDIVALVIESTKDEILGVNELGKGHGVGTKSQALVRECCKSWKRSSSDEEALLNVMKLGES